MRESSVRPVCTKLALAVVVEARAVLLLPEDGRGGVEPATEEPGLAQVEEETASPEAPAGEHGGGAAEAAEVAAGELDAAPQAVLLGPAHAPRPGRARGLLHAHHHVAAPRPLRVELGDRARARRCRGRRAAAGSRARARRRRARAGRSTISRSTVVGPGVVETGEHQVLDHRAGAGLDHQPHARLVPGLGERHLGPHPGVEVAGPAPGGQRACRGCGPRRAGGRECSARSASSGGPLPVAGGRQGRARDLERADHGPRAGAREEDDGEAAAALRHLGLDAGLEVPALLEAGDEERARLPRAPRPRAGGPAACAGPRGAAGRRRAAPRCATTRARARAAAS